MHSWQCVLADGFKYFGQKVFLSSQTPLPLVSAGYVSNIFQIFCKCKMSDISFAIFNSDLIMISLIRTAFFYSLPKMGKGIFKRNLFWYKKGKLNVEELLEIQFIREDKWGFNSGIGAYRTWIAIWFSWFWPLAVSKNDIYQHFENENNKKVAVWVIAIDFDFTNRNPNVH